jgi:hypothetical protein
MILTILAIGLIWFMIEIYHAPTIDNEDDI